VLSLKDANVLVGFHHLLLQLSVLRRDGLQLRRGGSVLAFLAFLYGQVLLGHDSPLRRIRLQTATGASG
jgi:hypothetical protein